MMPISMHATFADAISRGFPVITAIRTDEPDIEHWVLERHFDIVSTEKLGLICWEK